MGFRNESFHSVVSNYYDEDADLGFEARAESNPLLDRIRADFRAITGSYPFKSALEIGCGPGFDLEWCATHFPDRKVVGIDISEKMIALARKRIEKQKLNNASAFVADENKLSSMFTPGEFDLVFVFFGALNTVADLDYTAAQIHTLIKTGGHAVLTFVNKWYLREMLVQFLKMNFQTSFSRLRKEWGGYSTDRHLPSRCYSPRQIKSSFSGFECVEQKGYSITFPAWYNFRKYMNNEDLLDRLWLRDQKLQGTFLWSKGEYTLFVFRKH